MTTADKVLDALKAHNLKSKGSGKYTSNSPFRPGSDSGAFSLTITDGEHGAYHDFASDEKGSLYDLAKRLGIEATAAALVSTKRAYTNIDDYARAHGITADVLHAAGWKAVTRESRPALEFLTRTGIRWRFLDGKKPTYKSATGYKKCWYGIEKAVAKLDASTPLVICNGEISTVAAIHHGLAAASVTSGEGEIPNDLIVELVGKLWGTPGETMVIVALDCDRKGIDSARQIEAQFKAHGFNARAVDLQLGNGGDLADFCMLHGEQALAALLKCPPLPASESDIDDEDELLIYDITEFDKLPPVEWVIPGEIPKNGFVTIFGESNVGKSFIAVDYALRIAQENTVLYVACEGEAGVPKRVYGWCAHHNVKPDTLRSKFKMMVGPVSFFEREYLDKFINMIRPVRPLVVVVDTFALVMGGGDENSARDVTIFMKGSRRIQRAIGCTIIFIHHTSKGGDKERGSTALRGRMDTMIQVLPADDLIRIESAKTRDEKPFEPRYMKLLPIEVEGWGETLVPIPAEQVVRSNTDPLTPDQSKILDVMSLMVYADGITFKELAEAARLTVRRIQTSLSNLYKKGYVAKPKGSYAITDAGRVAIGLPALESSESDHADGESQTPADESLESSESQFLVISNGDQQSVVSDSSDSTIHTGKQGDSTIHDQQLPEFDKVPARRNLSDMGFG